MSRIGTGGERVQAVRVKVYGLVPMTRRRYLVQLTFAVVLSLALLGLWWHSWPGVRAEMRASPTPATRWVVAALNAAPWVILAAMVQQAVESWFVLRRFAAAWAASVPQPPPQ
jgi:hypothetical protein